MSDTNEPAAAVEAEAEQARAGLVNTLAQLRENLKPANVVDEVMTSARVNAAALSDQVWDTARRNPLPALMIGAGLAMIFGLGGRYGVQSLTGSGTSAVPKPPPVPTLDIDDRLAGRITPARPAPTSTLGRQASAALDAVSTRAGTLLDTANQRLTDAASRGASAVSTAYTQAKRSDPMTRSRGNVGSSLTHLIEEQPLILAAVGVAVGAALGAALPQTQTENDLMGDTSGAVRAQAQTLLQNQVAQAKAAANHAVQDIQQTIAEHGGTADNLSGLVQDIGSKAKSATYEAVTPPQS